MMDAVHSYEGTVNQVTGDGIMALIGAPIAHENQPAYLSPEQRILKRAEACIAWSQRPRTISQL
jgi:class 3 adenylate cyclase